MRESNKFKVNGTNLKSEEGDAKEAYQEAPVKSAADLGFMTEVDTDFRPKTKTRDDS